MQENKGRRRRRRRLQQRRRVVVDEDRAGIIFKKMDDRRAVVSVKSSGDASKYKEFLHVLVGDVYSYVWRTVVLRVNFYVLGKKLLSAKETQSLEASTRSN